MKRQRTCSVRRKVSDFELLPISRRARPRPSCLPGPAGYRQERIHPSQGDVMAKGQEKPGTKNKPKLTIEEKKAKKKAKKEKGK
jgi:hypothetical protein